MEPHTRHAAFPDAYRDDTGGAREKGRQVILIKCTPSFIEEQEQAKNG